MKLLLQDNWEAENMVDPVKQAIRQFRWKGNKVEVQYCPLGSIGFIQKAEMQFFTPIGTVEFVKTFAEKIGVKLPDPIHAVELLQLEDRWYHQDMYREACIHSHKYSTTMFPFFVKPMWELKKFTGFVARSIKDFDLYPEIDWSTTKLFCTEVLENIVSEWRCYVLNGKVFACVNYFGDPTCFPRTVDIDKMLYNYTNSPVAYSLDIAVCIDKEYSESCVHTSFIEINDAYALGYYGGDVELYTKMLNERWKEIIN